MQLQEMELVFGQIQTKTNVRTGGQTDIRES